MRFNLTFSLLLSVLLAMPGCEAKNANRGDVAGEVKLDGKPIEQGSILFSPIEGTQGVATGGKIENGRFRLSDTNGPTIGWNRVEIRVSRKTGRMIPKGLGGTGKMVEEQIEAVSPSYNSASTLRVEVKPGENTTNFDVSAK